jgi:hypothetical protein
MKNQRNRTVPRAAMVVTTIGVCALSYYSMHSALQVIRVKDTIPVAQVAQVTVLSTVDQPGISVTTLPTSIPTQVPVVTNIPATKVVRNTVLSSRGGYNLRSDVRKILEKKGEQYGLPESVWYPIVGYECSGDPSCKTIKPDKWVKGTDGKVRLFKGEDSRGLFQVNTQVHTKADKQKLLDPEYNCDWQMPTLARTYQQGLKKGLSGVALTKYVARYGQGPHWTTGLERQIEGYYNALMGGK